MILSWNPILCSLFGIINTSTRYSLLFTYRRYFFIFTRTRRKYICAEQYRVSYSVLKGSSPSPLPVSHKLFIKQSTRYFATSRLSSQIFSDEKSPTVSNLQSNARTYDTDIRTYDTFSYPLG